MYFRQLLNDSTACASYLFGDGNMDARLTAMEFNSHRFVVRPERHNMYNSA